MPFIFNELLPSEQKYTVSKNESFLSIDSTLPLHFKDSIWDEKGLQYIIAVNAYTSQFQYHVDYIFLNYDFEIKEVLTETEGVNPKFIIAPDKSVHVRLCYTGGEDNKEIVLPVYNRKAVSKLILKKDIGYDAYFYCNELFYGYDAIIFGGKCPKLSLFQFDKKNAYKGKKTYKLDFADKGMPFVDNGKFFIISSYWNDRMATIKVSELDSMLNTVCSEYQSDRLSNINAVNPVSLSGKNKKFLYATQKNKELRIVNLDENGKIVSDEKLAAFPQISEFLGLNNIVRNPIGKYANIFNSEEGNGLICFDDKGNVRTFFEENGKIESNGEFIYDFGERSYFSTLKTDTDIYIIAALINKASRIIIFMQ